MKKSLLILFSITASVSLSNASVTYQFSSTASYATNWLDGAGTAGSTLVWGIVVDAAGDGFHGDDALTPYDSGFTYSASSTVDGVVLNYLSGPTVSTASDDVLYISSNLMNLTTNTVDSGVSGINRITNLNTITYPTGVGAGDSFRVIWFDVTAFNAVSTDGTKYGMFDMPSNDTLQADPGTYNISAAFSGADAAKSMNYTLGTAIPEPSAALLGALGALALLRRRRN